MTNESNKIDWSNFNETEQQAIAIHSDNVANGTDHPTFPYSAVVFEGLAENLASIAPIEPKSALKMAGELQVLNDVLNKLMPIPPTEDLAELDRLFTKEEIEQKVLHCTANAFLITQFSNIINHILFALEAEMTATAEAYYE